MKNPISTLGLAERVRQGSQHEGATKREVRFQDFVIDGVSLYDTIAHHYDLVSILDAAPVSLKHQSAATRRMLLQDPADFPDGRVSRYVCPECGDRQCGAVTVVVRINSETVTWPDFGYEGQVDVPRDIPEFLKSVGPFQFDRQ